MSTKIVSVLGGVVQDLTTITDRIPDAGETVNALSFTMQAGGKGANSAVAVHRLTRPNPKNQPSDVVLENDIKVRMVGAVGDDQFGPALRQTLADCGVNVEGVRMIAGQATGVGNIIVEAESGANRIMQFPGAAWAVQPADFLTLESLGGGVVPDLVIAQLEIKRESIEQAIETAYEQGVEFLLNPSPAYCLMPELYRGITHLVVNETEAMMMSGCELQDLETHAGLTSVAEYFTKLGTKNVVITLGKKGAFFHNETTTGWIEAEKDCIVLDTSGAGDSFVGAYAAEYLKMKKTGEWDIKKAVVYGCKAAARVIEYLGCLDPIVWADEVDIPRYPPNPDPPPNEDMEVVQEMA